MLKYFYWMRVHGSTGMWEGLRSVTGLFEAVEAMTEWGGLLKRERTSLTLASMDDFSNCIIPFILIVSLLEGRAFHSPY